MDRTAQIDVARGADLDRLCLPVTRRDGEPDADFRQRFFRIREGMFREYRKHRELDDYVSPKMGVLRDEIMKVRKRAIALYEADFPEFREAYRLISGL
jgi:hypothetical protein